MSPEKSFPHLSPEAASAEFIRVLQIESDCIRDCFNRINADPKEMQSIQTIIEFLHQRRLQGGRLITLGVGKSGKIAAKLSATLSSTGFPSIYLHPTEVLHGDLGIVSENDVALAISYTGNTEEMIAIHPFFSTRKIPWIGIGGNSESKLAKKCQFWIDGSVKQEACSHQLAPTSSTTLALAIGDALAIALMKRGGFTAEDFAKNHPGGSLGRRLQLRVRDLMHPLSHCAMVLPNDDVATVLDVSAQKKLGAVLVGTPEQLDGIITDGDLRRALKHREKFFLMKAHEIMTVKPITVPEELLAYDALRLMEERESQISVLPVVNQQQKPVGLLRIHDLVQTL